MCSPNVLVNMCFSKCVSQHVHLLCARLFTSMLNSMLFCVGSNRTTVSVYQFVREVQKLFDVNGVGSNLSFCCVSNRVNLGTKTTCEFDKFPRARGLHG